MTRPFMYVLAVLFSMAALVCGAVAQDAARLEGDPASVEADSLLPACVCDVAADDVPDDGGGVVRVSWTQGATASPVTSLLGIYRYGPGEEPVHIGEAPATDTSYVDTQAADGTPYQYFIRSETDGGPYADSDPSGLATATASWFSTGRMNALVVTFLFCAAVLVFIARARGGIDLYIRKIPGLEAVDDAVGRATEMGRPVLYVPGIETVSEVGTLAALTILGHVAKKVAQHGTPLLVPCADPIVMTTAQEIVKQAYAEVGQSDRFDESAIAYLTYDQFGYTAGVDGIMVRERPEAVFLLGYFAAESLILAETGHAIGAIQISGTKETSQLPFFVAACDYTLIGEELFAASSYLSHEPVMLGSLKGQDLAKLAIVVFIVVLVLVGSIGYAVTPDGASLPARIFDATAGWF